MNTQTVGEAGAGRSLIDGFGRRIDYLRVSVTDRCDLRCSYCMPKHFKGFEEPANWLTHAEMARLVGLFVQLGVSKVRLTGGEPLMRRGVSDLAAQIGRMPGLRDLSLSTNGTTLARHAHALKAAGVHRLNVSLDALDAQVVTSITGRDCLADVLHGLQVAREQGLSPIKLNCVVHADTPEAQVERLLDFAIEQGFILRLIETMPMGSAGRSHQPANLTLLGQQLAARRGLVPALDVKGNGPARYWTVGAVGQGAPVLGVITPMSQHFCAACNRVRLTVDGQLHLCLGQEHRVPLGPLMRAGADDASLIAHIEAGIQNKPERHEFNTATERVVRFMSQTGG
jgi:cyclic pyranopterin phosphate synthase